MLGTDGQCDNRTEDGEPNIPVLLNLNAAEPQLSSWLPLYDAAYPNGEQNVNLYFYPFMFLLSNGQVLMCGAQAPDNPAQMRIARKLDVALGIWVPQAEFGPTATITGVSACMYQKDKIFKVGEISVTGQICSDPNRCSGSKAAAYLDLNLVPPVWVSAGQMQEFRCHYYAVPTPDGRVHVVGGPGNTGGNPNVPPEVWDPYSNTWDIYDAAPAVNRDYHHSAVLLPDGSIFVAGGECESYAQKSYEIFKPHYFHEPEVRPLITSAPQSIYYGQGFDVDVSAPGGAPITKVRLIRLGAATHSFDMDTRSLELAFVPTSANRIRVAPPAHHNEAPAGYYMLFVAIGPNGFTPSTGEIVRLEYIEQAG